MKAVFHVDRSPGDPAVTLELDPQDLLDGVDDPVRFIASLNQALAAAADDQELLAPDPELPVGAFMV